MTERTQVRPNGTSGQVEQAARRVGADGKHRVVKVFVPLE